MAKKPPTKPAKKAGKGKVAPKKAVKKAAKTSKPVARTRRAVDRRALFVKEYLVDLNGTQAAMRAGYSPATARVQACELLALPEIQAKVQEAMDARSMRTEITADAVLKRFWATATADPRALIELHRGCCRYCWGKNNRWQSTPRELEEARAAHGVREDEAAAAGKSIKPFDEAGGVGYDPRKDPNPKCPECFGEGEQRIVTKDTRYLSPEASLLYAGVKTTQHGLEIKMHDQQAALVNVGKHLGMFKEKVELTGADGKPMQMQQTIGDVLGEIDGAGTGLPRHADRE